jgi:ABC-type branched-subunit amino acid transport system ATPase component/predicted MFS family arabinose efflux permease
MSNEPSARDAVASSLAATVLAEEEYRLAEDASRVAREELADERIPGFGEAHMPLKEAFHKGGYRTLALICAAVACSDIDSAALHVLAPNIQESFQIGDTLLAAISALTSILLVGSSLPVGYYGDRVKRVRIVSIVMGVFSVFVTLMGFVQAAWQLGVVRFGAGVGRAIEPVKLSLLIDAYPIPARARILGLQRAAQAGSYVIGPLAAGLIAHVVIDGVDSWRYVWLVLAIPTVVIAISTWTIKEPRRGKNEVELLLGDTEGGVVYRVPPLANAFARLRNIKTFYYFLVGKAVMGFGLLSFGVFFSLYMEEHLGYSPLQRGLVSACTASGGVVGSLWIGPRVDRIWRANPVRAVLLAAALLCGFVMNVIGMWMPEIWMTIPCLMVGVFCIFSSIITSQTVLASVQPPRMRSQAQSLLLVYQQFIGGFGGAIIVGRLSDALGPRTAITIAVPPAIIIGAAFMAYGARFVKRDIQLMVEELDEERMESERLRAGGSVPLLQVRNLDFAYGSLQILFDINFDLERGETLALLGTNGAGKSTLLRAVSGLGIPTRGVVRLNGQTLTYSDAESRFNEGILQVRGADVFPGISVEDNLKASLLASPEKWGQSEELMERVFEIFPVLRQRRKQDAASLSGGEQQMVAFGTALMHKPEVLLIDELSLGLAPLVVQELLAVVERLKEEGMTMIIVEQSLNVAVAITDRAIFIEKGRIRFDGPTSELVERGDLARAVFLGGEGG